MLRQYRGRSGVAMDLARRDLCPHGQTMRVDEEVDLGREATS